LEFRLFLLEQGQQDLTPLFIRFSGKHGLKTPDILCSDESFHGPPSSLT